MPIAYEASINHDHKARPACSLVFLTCYAGPSFLSTTDSESDTFREDDQAHLTAKNLTLFIPNDNADWKGDYEIDSENFGGVTPRTRRRTVARLSGTPSPLQRTSTAIKTAWRHASMRVANVHLHDTSIRLPDDDETYSDVFPTPTDRDDNAEDVSDPYRSGSTTPLRGCTLGFLGPQNPFRLKLYYMLSHSCVRFFAHDTET